MREMSWDMLQKEAKAKVNIIKELIKPQPTKYFG